MKLICHNPNPKEIALTGLLFFVFCIYATDMKGQGNQVLYRVNAGGPQIEDVPIHWDEDQAATSVYGFAKKGIPSEYLTFSDITNEDQAYAVSTFSGTNETPYPNELFATERFSSSRSSQSQTWDFPVSKNGIYKVNLLLAEVWDGAKEPGKRFFGISIEGNVVDDTVDVVAEVGWNTASVKSYQVEVHDGNLDINLLRKFQNPNIKGIEIIGPAGANINLPPRFVTLPLVRGEAGQTVNATFATQEKDGDAVALEIAFQDQNGNTIDPNTYNFTDHGDGTGDLVWETQETDNFLYNGTITASDKDGATSKYFTISISEKVQKNNILYRVNAGGMELQDASYPERMHFSGDTETNPSGYVTKGRFFSTEKPVTVNTSVPGYVPLALFQTERFQWISDKADMIWSFPVPENKMVNVRLYFGEIFLTEEGANSNENKGPRVFDIIINQDTVEKALNVFNEVGANVGIMRSYNVISQGSVNIGFNHIAENPNIKGIEILEIEPLNVEVIKEDAACFGGYGSATAAINGGIGPYEVSWGDGINPQQLLPGTYSITVKDASGQQALKSITINQAEAIKVTIDTKNATLAGVSDGSASATVSGGKGPYQYAWGEGIHPESLTAGEYILTVTDANGCSSSNAFIIGDPETLAVNVKTTNPACFGSTGYAEVVVSGGTAPYDIVWDNGVDPLALPVGEYKVTVTDHNGKKVEKQVTITQPATNLKVVFNTIDASAHGVSDGSVRLDVSGGTPPYNIFWGGINPTVLAAGTYNVLVKDAAGCEKQTKFAIGQPDVLRALISKKDATCDEAGSATLEILGGTYPYNVTWGNHADPDKLPSGIYEVVVTDANNVRVIKNVEILLDCDAPLATADPEVENYQLKLYPIPGDQILNIGVPASIADKEGTIRIYTTYGQKVLEQKVNTFSLHTVNISHLSRGAYILEVTSKNTVLKSRFLIGN